MHDVIFYKITPSGTATPPRHDTYLLKVDFGSYELRRFDGPSIELERISDSPAELRFALQAGKEKPEIDKALRRYLREPLEFTSWSPPK